MLITTITMLVAISLIITKKKPLSKNKNYQATPMLKLTTLRHNRMNRLKKVELKIIRLKRAPEKKTPVTQVILTTKAPVTQVIRTTKAIFKLRKKRHHPRTHHKQKRN